MHTNVCTYLCVHAHTFMNQIMLCRESQAYMCMLVFPYTCEIYVCVYIYIYTYMHMYIYICMHIYTAFYSL